MRKFLQMEEVCVRNHGSDCSPTRKDRVHRVEREQERIQICGVQASETLLIKGILKDMNFPLQ